MTIKRRDQKFWGLKKYEPVTLPKDTFELLEIYSSNLIKSFCKMDYLVVDSDDQIHRTLELPNSQRHRPLEKQQINEAGLTFPLSQIGGIYAIHDWLLGNKRTYYWEESAPQKETESPGFDPSKERR